MSMRALYLLRHAIAVERGTPGYRRDRDRPLTLEGEKKMRRIARGLQALELSFDVILSSPFVRAKQTAEIVAARFQAEDRLAFTDALAVGGDHQVLIRELQDRYAQARSLLLVGHEPSLSILISTLLGGDSSLFVVLKKGGVCKLSIDSLKYGRCATLEWLLAPNQLTRMRPS
jgi:phosphohistidine phosphatase